jgi:predicted nucleotidyltransferase
MVHETVNLPEDALAEFCARWKIRELSLFGSVLTEAFGDDSDIDVLVSFADDAEWSLFDHVEMQDELEAMLGRDVDLVSRRGIERSPNPIRKAAILGSAEVVYAAP